MKAKSTERYSNYGEIEGEEETQDISGSRPTAKCIRSVFRSSAVLCFLLESLFFFLESLFPYKNQWVSTVNHLACFRFQDPCYWIYGSRRDYLRLTGFPLSVSTSTLHRRSYPSFVVCLEIPWSSKPFGSLVLESFSTSMPVNVQYLQS